MVRTELTLSQITELKIEGGLSQPPSSQFPEFRLEIYFTANGESSHRPETSTGVAERAGTGGNIVTVAPAGNR
jgi:hypothetical protein